MHEHHAPNALLLALVGIPGKGAGLQLATVDAHKREGAQERIRRDLEGQRRQGLLVIGLPRECLVWVLHFCSLQVHRQVFDISSTQDLHRYLALPLSQRDLWHAKAWATVRGLYAVLSYKRSNDRANHK